jgi:hypothetical protein
MRRVVGRFGARLASEHMGIFGLGVRWRVPVVYIRLVILTQCSVAKRNVLGESAMFLMRCDMLHINELSAHDGPKHAVRGEA